MEAAVSIKRLSGAQEVELFHSMAGGEADSAAKPGEGEDQANAPEGGSTPPASS